MSDLSAEFQSWWNASYPNARPNPQSAAICVAFAEHVAALAAQPPAPASDGDRANVAEALMDEALWFEKGGRTSETMRRAATLLRQPASAPAAVPVARPANEWHEDLGAVLWWRFPIEEPPYCGSPLDTDWPGYHTHFTLLVIPQPPQGGEVQP